MAAQQGVFHINLLPKDSFSYSPLGRFLSWATTSGRVLVVLTEFVVLLAFGSRFYFDKRVNDLNDEIGQKETQIAAFAETESSYRRVLAKQTPVTNYLDNNISFGSRYAQLASFMPRGVTLDKLVLDDKGLEVSGQADSELGFAQLLQNLKKIEDLSRLSMRETNFDQNTGSVKFSIQMSFK